MPVIVGVGGSISGWEDLLIDYLTNVGLFNAISAYTLARHSRPALATHWISRPSEVGMISHTQPEPPQ